MGPNQGASPLVALFVGVFAACVLTLSAIIVATKLRCRARASSLDGMDDSKGEESEDGDRCHGDIERRNSAKEVMTIRAHEYKGRARGTFSPQQQQQQQHHSPQQPLHQIKHQQKQHFYGRHPSHETGK